MKNQFPPLDNSMSTQMRYDLFAEKMNNAQRSYNVRYNNTSISDSFMVAGGVFQIIGGLLLMVFGVVRWLWLKLK